MARDPWGNVDRSAPALTRAGFGYQPALDGLRALAVMGVLFFHSGFSWARGGYLGVSAFFTLSGFLITTLLVIEYRDVGRIALGAFWARRARRLLPAAFAAVAVAALYVMFAAPHHVVVEFRGDGLAALFDVANWRFVLSGRGYLDTFAAATGVQSAQSPVLHFWSLAIEEQFYLVFPPLFYGLLRLARGRLAVVGAVLVAMTAASGVAAYVLGRSDHSRAYFGADARAAELLVGALLAVVFVSRRDGRSRGQPTLVPVARNAIGALGAAALVVAMIGWSAIDHRDPMLFRGALLLHASLTAIVIACALQAGWFARVLSVRPLVELGKISYGVYVFHWPIFQWIDGRADGRTGWSLFAVRMVVTLAVSVASYRLIEQPMRHGGTRRLAPRVPILAWAIPAWAAVVVLVIGAWSSPPAPTTVFAPVSASAASAAGRPGGQTEADAAVRAIDRTLPAMPAPRVTPTSVVPKSSASTTTSATVGRVAPERVLIVGDSVALTLGRGLERWGAAHEVAVWNLGRPTCGIPRSPILVAFETIRSETCEAWPRLWSTAVAGFAPDVVIVLSPIWDAMPHQADGWHDMRAIGDPQYDRWLLGEYHAAVDVVSAGGARVFWLDSPCAEDKQLSEASARLNVVITRLARERADTRLVSLARLLCDPVGEFADARDSDGFHFSDSGADLMAEWLMPQLALPS
jgi:peptidoglycan/LPS O-acetylase OafA/YrhL